MLKLSKPIVVKVTLRAQVKCPAHPRFNPEQGEAKIKGGCKHCTALLDVVDARDKVIEAHKLLLEAIARFESVTKPYKVERKKLKRPQ